MSLETFLKTSKQTVQDNSPSILAALAVGGVVTTALAAYSFGHDVGYEEAMLEEVENQRLTGKEKFERYWRRSLPMFITVGTTVTCVIASTAINNRRNAILGGTLAISETAYRELREKVEKVVTKPKVEQIDREIAQDKLNGVDDKEVVFVGEGEVLLFDTLSSRTFKSTKMDIQKAEIEIGRRLLSEMYVSLNEWYDEIGLGRTAMGDDVGWNHNMPLEVKFVALERDDKPVLGLDYRFRPAVGFDRFG